MIKANSAKFDTEYAIEGSESNLKIKELVLLQAELQQKVDKLAKQNAGRVGAKPIDGLYQ